MSLLTSLLTLGVVPLAHHAGAWLTNDNVGKDSASALERPTLAVIAGLGVLTLPLVAMAQTGYFRPAWLGAAGWILLAATIAIRRVRGAPRGRVGRADAFIVAAISVFVFIALQGRDETIAAGRDQQVYATFALNLARSGGLEVRYGPVDAADRALLQTGYRREACKASLFQPGAQRLKVTSFVVPGATNACDGVDEPLTLLHPSGWPVWLAIAIVIGGKTGLYAANAIVFALGALVLYLLLRRLVAPGIACGTTLLFVALPSSLWISGITLSEPLAMAMLLAVAVLALGEGWRRTWAMAILLMAATLVRIDAALAYPAVLAAIFLSRLHQDDASIRADAGNARIALVMMSMVIAGIVYVVWYPSYLDATMRQSIAIAATATLVGVLTVALSQRARQALGRVAATSVSRLTVVSVLVGSFCYAALIRPTRAPFSVFPPGSALEGLRDFREDSLLNLAANLSWPVTVAALLGASAMVWRQWATRKEIGYPLLLTLGLCPTVLYLTFPLVGPDQPWAFRRFVTLAVPFALVYAAILIEMASERFGRVIAWVGTGALMACWVLLFLAHSPAVLLFRENEGMTKEVSQVAAALPEDLVVSTTSNHDIPSALLVGLGKNVAGFNLPQDARGREVLTTWINAKHAAGRPAWLLHSADQSLAGLRTTQAGEWWLHRNFVTPAERAPARTTTRDSAHVVLSRIDGMDSDFGNQRFGGEPLWGIAESGFFASEVAAFGTFRYTNGNAWMELPAAALSGAQALALDVFVYAPRPVSRHLEVTLDGRTAWTGGVGAGLTTLRIPVTGIDGVKPVRIGIVSERADPADLGRDNPRVDLSAGLVGLRVIKREQPPLPEGSTTDFRSQILVERDRDPIQIPRGGEVPLIVRVRNPGTTVWPGADAQSHPLVEFALTWYRPGDDRPVATGRWPLYLTMHPGDKTRLRLSLKAATSDGAPLPPGSYDIRLSMIREGSTPVAITGDTPAAVSVQVVP